MDQCILELFVLGRLRVAGGQQQRGRDQRQNSQHSECFFHERFPRKSSAQIVAGTFFFEFSFEDVQDRGHDQGEDQDPQRLLGLEREAAGGMRNALKSDERPRRHRDDRHDPPESVFLRGKAHVAQRDAVLFDERKQRYEDDRGGEDGHQPEGDAGGDPLWISSCCRLQQRTPADTGADR